MSGKQNVIQIRTQVEDDLRESQARLRLALDASGIGMWDANFVSGKVLLDSHWAEMVGGEPGETLMQFRALLKQVAPEERATAEEQIRAVRRGDGDDYRMEQRVRHRLGHWIWIESRGRVIARDSAGRALRMIGTNTDITGQKQALAEHRRQTESLLRQKEFLEALHQTGLDLLNRREMADLLQVIVERSSALLDAPFGELSLVDVDEFVVRAFTRNQPFLLGDRVGRNEAQLSWQAYDTGQPVVVDDYSQIQEHRQIYDRPPRHAVAIFPILHGSRCLGVLGLSRTTPGHSFSDEEIQHGVMLAQQAALVLHNASIYDSSVQEAEARTIALRESEERFRGVFDKSPVIIGLLTLPEGRFAEVNAAGLAAFGYTREEAIGRTSLELNIWADPSDRDRYIRLLQADGSFSGYEAQMRRKNGEIFTVLYSGSLMKIGGTTYTLNTLQDITVQKQAVERLRQSHKIELLGNLAGGIAHDFNNILSGMLGNVELARLDLPETHSARRWVDRIGAAAGYAKNLVQQILTFSRMEEGKLVPAKLQPVVAAAVQLMRTTMPSMMRIDAQISDECLPVMADETQIHQVVMNLCTNAWHALPEHGGWITVRLAPLQHAPERLIRQTGMRPGPFVLLSVRDNGCGMDAATLQRIFEPFFTTKDTGKGTGLGLAVTHGIVKAHFGAITVESTPGQGSVFEIYLPAIEVLPASPAAAPAASLVHGRNEHILFVDDEPDVGIPLGELLQRLGYQLTYELDPRAALALFQADPQAFDLVITDLAMPGMTGSELASEILRLRPDIPVIMLTGLIEQKMREHILRMGVRKVLAKPATLGDLATAVAGELKEGQ